MYVFHLQSRPVMINYCIGCCISLEMIKRYFFSSAMVQNTFHSTTCVPFMYLYFQNQQHSSEHHGSEALLCILMDKSLSFMKLAEWYNEIKQCLQSPEVSFQNFFSFTYNSITITITEGPSSTISSCNLCRVTYSLVHLSCTLRLVPHLS